MLSADFEISTDRSRLDVELIYNFLSMTSYWAETAEKVVYSRIRPAARQSRGRPTRMDATEEALWRRAFSSAT